MYLNFICILSFFVPCILDSLSLAGATTIAIIKKAFLNRSLAICYSSITANKNKSEKSRNHQSRRSKLRTEKEKSRGEYVKCSNHKLCWTRWKHSPKALDKVRKEREIKVEGKNKEKAPMNSRSYMYEMKSHDSWLYFYYIKLQWTDSISR